MAVADEAIEELKAMIVSGEFRPGQRLPGKRTSPPPWACRAARSHDTMLTK